MTWDYFALHVLLPAVAGFLFGYFVIGPLVFPRR